MGPSKALIGPWSSFLKKNAVTCTTPNHDP